MDWFDPARVIKAASVGQMTHDLCDGVVYSGGSAFYSARTFDALGAYSILVTAMGEDFINEADLAGLEVWENRGSRTIRFVNDYDSEGRRRQSVECSSIPVSLDVYGAKEEYLDIVFLAPVFGELVLKEWVGAVRAGCVGLGLQGFLREGGSSRSKESDRREVISRWVDLGGSFLHRIDVVFVSEEDVQAKWRIKILEAVRRSSALLVLTRGRNGALIFEGETVKEIGSAPTRCIDATGAGDTYAAAFLFALAQGGNSTEAGRFAAAAASLVIEGYGATRMGSVDQVFERMKKVPFSGN